MFRKLLASLVFTFCVACASSPSAPSSNAAAPVGAEAAAPDPARFDELVIVGTNDVHGYIRTVNTQLAGAPVRQGGAEWFAGYVRVLEQNYGDHLVLLDAGDLFQGTMESNFFLGRPVIDYYNTLPYRASALGNHEFDYGPVDRRNPDRLGALKARMRQAKFPFVQANIYLKGTNQVWREKNLGPTAMFTAAGYRIGVIGLTTPTTAAKTLPLNVKKLEFREMLQPTLEQAANLRRQGADFVILLAHEGGDKPGEPINELIRALPPGTLDAAVTGHTHTEIHAVVNGVPTIQSRARGVFFGRMNLYVNKATRKIEPSLTRIYGMQQICGDWFRQEERCDVREANEKIKAGRARLNDYLPTRPVSYEGQEVKADPLVQRTLAPYFAKTDEKKQEVLGRASRDTEFYPTGETEMGDLWMEAFRWKFPQAKVTYLNGGGFRRRFFAGPITYGDVFEVNPFDNFVVLNRVTGRQLKEIVRVGVSGANMLPAVSGIKIAYYGSDDPKFDRDVNHDGKKDKWERDRLVPGGLTWADTGAEVKDDEEFTLATSDYLVTGGDNLDVVFNGVPAAKRKYYDITQRDVAAEYLRAHPGAPEPRPLGPRIHRVD